MSAIEPHLRLPGGDAVDLPVLIRRDDEWVLSGSRCLSCDRSYYPPRVLCPDDLSECEHVVLSSEGVVYAAAQVHLGPIGFPPPYWVSWVDLPEGVRVYTILDVPEGRSAEPGDLVTLAPRIVRTDPEPVLGPVFRLDP